MKPIDILDMFLDFSQEQKGKGFKLTKSSLEKLEFENGTETVTYTLEDIINYNRLKKLKRLIDDSK